ncbi:MAG: molybdopterin cofactor-binding domain-containing protein, partial [Planctomycetota bacterium]
MTLSASFANNPELDAWLQIHGDGRITVRTGKVELGQKLKTAFAVIAAEELDVDPGRITVRTAATGGAPNEGYTSGSNSMEDSGTAIRQAAAEARKVLLDLASEHLGERPEHLTVTDGQVSAGGSGPRVAYWELMGDRRFDRKVSAESAPKRPDLYRLIGKPVPAEGFEALVSGAVDFVHDLSLPQMAHARVVRPPNYHSQLLDLDDTAVRALPGVLQVIRDGRFLAVVCEREEQAVWAASRLSGLAVWDQSQGLASGDIFQQLKINPRQSLPVVEGVPQDGPASPATAPAGAEATLSATYQRPYTMHGSMAPSAAMARFDHERLEVWTHSQGVYPLRKALASVLEIPEETIDVVHVPGAGCYGHNGADDVALDAALAARALPGRPVLLKWERGDEHGWEPYGPAMVMDLQASLDGDGRVIHWSHETYSDTHTARLVTPGNTSRLLAAWHLGKPLAAPKPGPNRSFHGGIHRNADPLYDFPERRVVKHLVANLPLRTSALRSLGAYGNVFAAESFMDELALASGADPLAFRLAHLTDERGRAVLEAAAAKADWRAAPRPDGQGQGLAFARYKNIKAYAAVVIDLEVDDYGAIRLRRAVIAADAGQIVDPEGLKSQLEGGLIQSASWTLKEQVNYDSGGILSRDWDSYPILTMAEAPVIETVLIDRPDQPF